MTTNKAFSYTTNEDGKFKIISSSLNLGNIIISHDDYFEQDAEYGPNKQYDLRNSKDRQFTLIKRPKQNNIEFILASRQQANIYVKRPNG